MAIAQSAPYPYAMQPEIVTQFDCSSLVSDKIESLSHGGPTGATVSAVEFEITTRPTDGSQLSCEHVSASDSTTGNTIALRFWVQPGGSIDGAVVRVRVRFRAMASNSIGTWVSLGGTTIP